MARTATITDDDLSVNLIQTAGIKARSPRGFGSVRFDPAAYDMRVPNEDAQLFVENWELIVQGTDHDNLATQTRVLIKLLRRAFLYRTNQRYRETHQPVYIKNQLTDETNARYALVHGCRALEHPDLYGPITTDANMIAHLGVNIARYIWRDDKPGTLPSAVVLEETDGPATPTKVHISNHRDNGTLTHIYNSDFSGGPSYSANLIAATGWTIFPVPYAQWDGILFGSANTPFKTIVIPMGTAGINHAGTFRVDYSDGVGTTSALTLGTDYTCYPGPTIEDCLEQNAEDIVINLIPPSDWVKDTWNGVSAFWLFILETNGAPSWGTQPVSGSTVVYAQRTPEVRIPATVLEGDVPPYLLARFHSPAGGDENEGFANISRIIAGLKTDPGVFTSHINLGGDDNPTDWTDATGTDGARISRTDGAGGRAGEVDFAGDETMVMRLEHTGPGKLSAWIGEYRVFVTAEQIGGAAGETAIMLRTYIHATETYSPKYDTKTVASQGTDQGWEVFDLGKIKIPFTRMANADDLTDADIIFQIHAERTAGAGELNFNELILIPVDQWSVELDDPITDSVNGTSALRGGEILQMDGGVLGLRTGKATKSGAYLYSTEEWGRGGPSLKIEPETEAYLYFLMMHYPAGGTWGEAPFIASMGCHFAFELYSHACYEILRGDD